MALFLITGASGTGKTTIAQSLQDRGIWRECVSTTTRKIREKDGEKEGRTYYYISDEEFELTKAQGGFVEHVEYHGNKYAVSVEEVEKKLGKYENVFIIVEYNGYKQIKEKYPDAVGIYLHTSKENCVMNMLKRGDSLEGALERVSTYDEEIKVKKHYDYVVKNLSDRVNGTKAIIRAIVAQNS